MIGLEIDLKKMLSAGRVITLTAGAQILGCLLLGWAIFGFFGPAKNHLEALYLAVAAAMSSTVIIVIKGTVLPYLFSKSSGLGTRRQMRDDVSPEKILD